MAGGGAGRAGTDSDFADLEDGMAVDADDSPDTTRGDIKGSKVNFVGGEKVVFF